MCLLTVFLLQCRSSLCLHPENVLSLWCFYYYYGRPYASRICSIFPLWMESKVLVKSTNSIVACRLFARTPSRIIQIVNISEVVDLFLRKPFWFFLRMLSILGSMRLRSRALYILAAMLCLCRSSEVDHFRESEDASFHPSVNRILIINCITVSEQYVVELAGLPYFWGNFIKPSGFSIFNFSKYWVELFSSKRS